MKNIKKINLVSGHCLHWGEGSKEYILDTMLDITVLSWLSKTLLFVLILKNLNILNKKKQFNINIPCHLVYNHSVHNMNLCNWDLPSLTMDPNNYIDLAPLYFAPNLNDA